MRLSVCLSGHLFVLFGHSHFKNIAETLLILVTTTPTVNDAVDRSDDNDDDCIEKTSLMITAKLMLMVRPPERSFNGENEPS